jgi:NAD(P)-dependent dehydrogenase (short-subunit alcohol dehydrogenase family)
MFEVVMIEKAYRIDGRTAFVVGAGNGIGRAIAETFAAAGASVACLDLEEARAAETVAAIEAAGGKAIAVRCDVASERSVTEAVTAAISGIGPPRVLVNGAAVHDPSGTIVEITPAWWNQVIAVNLTGAFLVSRAAIPAMAAAGGGSIIHIASQMGRVGAPGRAAYTATKGALIQLAKTMALDHARDGIRVNTLSPGAVETRRMEFRWGDMAKAREMSGPLHPIGRLGQPGEIGLAALYLASDASAFMTGSDLLIDGGYTAI